MDGKKLESTKYLSFHSWGGATKDMVETHTSSDLFLWAAGGDLTESSLLVPLSLSFLTSISTPLHKHHTKCNSS